MHLFCLYWFPLIFTHININFYEKSAIFVIVFENCVSLTGIPILNANLIFFGMSQCSIYHMSCTDVDTIESHLHAFYEIVDRNEFIFFTENISYSQMKD